MLELDFEKFFKAYLECALWSSTDDNEEYLDSNYNIEDIHIDSINEMKQECLKFFETNKDMFIYNNELYSNEELAGHDFWLTHNGHGTGFWDRDLEYRDLLSQRARECGERWLYVGDDNNLYV